MIRLVILALIIAVIIGVIGYEDNKMVIDTQKGTEVLSESKKFIDENVELK